MPGILARFRFVGVAMVVGAAGMHGCADRTPRGFAGLEPLLDELDRDGSSTPNHDSSAEAAPVGSIPSAGPITLADLLEAAKAGSPALAVARSEVGIAASQVWQASLYPNPSVELSSEEIPFRSGVDDGITTISINQPIVLGDRLRAAVDAAEAERDASRARLELAIQETFGEIAQLHARVLAIRQAEALYAQLYEIGDQTLSMAKTRFDAKAAPETEVIRPQIELYQIDLARARLAKEKLAASQQLSLLIGGTPVDVDRLAGEVSDDPPAVDHEGLAAFIRSQHPAVIAADRDMFAAEARLNRVRSERMPDLEVQAGVGYQGESDEGIYELGVGMTLPLWDNRQGDVLAARFDLMRARQQRSAVEHDLLRRLAEATGEYESARAQLQTVRDQIIPAALRSYEQTQEAYRGGRAAFLELLDAQRTLTEVRTTFVELSGMAAMARARIMQIVGRLDGFSPAESSAKTEGQSQSTTITTEPQVGAEVMK